MYMHAHTHIIVSLENPDNIGDQLFLVSLCLELRNLIGSFILIDQIWGRDYHDWLRPV